MRGSESSALQRGRSFLFKGEHFPLKKAEVAQRIHQAAGIPLDEAIRLLDWILEFFKTILRNGESINISGFGKFTVRNKQARTGRNPKTGEAITISPRRVVTFRTSLEFKKAINPPSVEGQEVGNG